MDTKTQAIVLRRVDYGEADRILELLTPLGKMSVIAKGVKREKSKMAGGIELFGVSDVVVRRRREEGMGILSSVRGREFYGDEMVGDLERLKMGYEMLLDVAKRSEGVVGDGAGEFFDVAVQAMRGIARCGAVSVVRYWWRLNMLRLCGEEVNLWRDAEGVKLSAEQNYTWDGEAQAFRAGGGDVGVDEIKVLRLMVSARLPVVIRVEGLEEIMKNLEKARVV
jgi:DNA repair protein RecO (recombination protein O)